MNKSTAQIRQAFLDFFKSKKHHIVESSSLVPHDDPTLLFTNAGMNQFKETFLGLDNRAYTRAASAQRCVRAGGKHNDLENVGYTARHHTFFEMLGNFSFGDYFKKEAIHYAWELLTSPEWFALPKSRLWVTVYATDDEAFTIWHKDIGVPHDRIIRIGDNKGAPYASDNFWQMGDTGPCGPCTEIFYDHGEKIWGGPPGTPEESGDRFIEIWNLVFMQFNRQADGTLIALPRPSVDTGMGLERMAAVLQHVHSNYDIDLFKSLMHSVAEITRTHDLNNKSLRVIADHIRASAFLIADGVYPSNEGRGYVLRRIIRRALRHGNKLGVEKHFFYRLVSPLIRVMDKSGDILKAHQEQIEQILKAEEVQFSKTLARGLALLDDALSHLKGNILEGETLFRLYDTYGFPVDLTADICREHHIDIDHTGFEKAMAEQRQRARAASHFDKDYNNPVFIEAKSTFNGYDQLASHGHVIGIYVNGEARQQLISGEEGIILLDETPFYAESGGQIGDTGRIEKEKTVFIVENTKKQGQATSQFGKLLYGQIHVGDEVKSQVDEARRKRIRINHSATHLLHAALRHVLGTHITQKGSLVDDKRLRFDFSHFTAIDVHALREVENWVNAEIRNNLPIKTQIMSLNDAKATGAMALFGEKYDSEVRVLSMGDVSVELCGGTHAQRTGDIGLFLIVSESGTAAGTRRIEAITGETALTYVQAQSSQLIALSSCLKTNVSELNEKVTTIIKQKGELEVELQALKTQLTAQEINILINKVKELGSVKVLISQVNSLFSHHLRTMVDELKNRLNPAVIILATVIDGKISLIAGVSKPLTGQIKANELIAILARELGGKGGGRPDMAQGGGINIQTLPKAMKEVETLIREKLVGSAF